MSGTPCERYGHVPPPPLQPQGRNGKRGGRRSDLASIWKQPGRTRLKLLMKSPPEAGRGKGGAGHRGQPRQICRVLPRMQGGSDEEGGGRTLRTAGLHHVVADVEQDEAVFGPRLELLRPGVHGLLVVLRRRQRLGSVGRTPWGAAGWRRPVRRTRKTIRKIQPDLAHARNGRGEGWPAHLAVEATPRRHRFDAALVIP